MEEHEHITALVEQVADPPWLTQTTIALGPTPLGCPTPHCHVCVSAGDTPLFRIDAYAAPDEYDFREEAMIVESSVLVGIGHRAYAVDLETHQVRTLILDSYFSAFHRLEYGALVCTGNSLYRISSDCTLVWMAANLGVDGVTVYDAGEGVVHGDAEVDPPNGWQPFTLALETGLPL